MKIIKKLIIILFVLALLFEGYYIYNKYVKNNSKKEVKVVKRIPEYGYKLNDNETKLYKDTFDELDKILSSKSVDYEKYGVTICKLFIIDFYTLSNKVSKNDIGGVSFIKESMRDNFIDQARSTFYRYIQSGNNSLPEVNKILSTDIEKTTFDVKETNNETTTSKSLETKKTTYEAYKVNITWDYKKDLGYEKEANIILIKEDKMLYIVEMD